jgi:hypothetical protein
MPSAPSAQQQALSSVPASPLCPFCVCGDEGGGQVIRHTLFQGQAPYLLPARYAHGMPHVGCEGPCAVTRTHVQPLLDFACKSCTPLRSLTLPATHAPCFPFGPSVRPVCKLATDAKKSGGGIRVTDFRSRCAMPMGFPCLSVGSFAARSVGILSTCTAFTVESCLPRGPACMLVTNRLFASPCLYLC